MLIYLWSFDLVEITKRKYSPGFVALHFKNHFSIYNIFVSLSEKAGEDKLLAKQVMEYFPNLYCVINGKTKLIELVKTVGKGQGRANGMQTEVIRDKEEFQEEIAKVRLWGLLWCEGSSIFEGQGRTKWCPFDVTESLSFFVGLELTILE